MLGNKREYKGNLFHANDSPVHIPISPCPLCENSPGLHSFICTSNKRQGAGHSRGRAQSRPEFLLRAPQNTRDYVLPAAPGQNSGARSPAQARPSLPNYYDESSILWKSKLNVLLSNVALGSPARSAAIARRDRAFSGACRPDRRLCGCYRGPTHNTEPWRSHRSSAAWLRQAGLVAAQFLGWAACGGNMRRARHALRGESAGPSSGTR